MSQPLPTSRALAALTDAKVFNLLASGPATRTEIARNLGISKPTASLAITRLQQFGLVSEGISTAGGKRGRIPEIYALRPGYGHVLAVGLSAQCLEFSAHDLAGNELADLKTSIDSRTSEEAVLVLAGQMLEELEEQVRSPRLATGLSQAAPVLHAQEGTSRLVPTPIFAASGVDLAGLFDPETTLLDNDVNWMAVAEHQHREGSMLLVYVGAGIGSSLVIDGAVYRGRHGVVGELETQFVNGRTLLAHLDSAGLVDGGVLFEKLVAPEHRKALTEPLGQVLGNLVGFLDPETLVVTGPGASEELTCELGEVIARKPALVKTPIVYSPQGGGRALAGAASGALGIALENLWKQYRRA